MRKILAVLFSMVSTTAFANVCVDPAQDLMAFLHKQYPTSKVSDVGLGIVSQNYLNAYTNGMGIDHITADDVILVGSVVKDKSFILVLNNRCLLASYPISDAARKSLNGWDI